MHLAAAELCADGETLTICVPEDYMKFELPEEGEKATHVSIGVDVKDIPKVNDKDFSITMNAYFIVKWTDRRLGRILCSIRAHLDYVTQPCDVK